MQWDVLVSVDNTGSAVKYRDGAIDTLVCSQLLKAAGALGDGRVLLKAVAAEEFVQH